MHVSEMMQMTREVATLFDEQVGPWSVPVMLTELMAEVGTLADSLMIQQGYRRSRGEALDLPDDFADLLFMLLRLADQYQIDLEQAYRQMLHRTREQLLHQASPDLSQQPGSDPAFLGIAQQATCDDAEASDSCLSL